MLNIKISIITITFNDLIGLKETVESIDKQFKTTNSYINHFIIDGNSTDGTIEFLSGVVNGRMINTKIISEPDLGIYDAMNKGVLNSNADFVIFINSGDLLLPAFFDKQIHQHLVGISKDTKCAGLALGCIYNFNGDKFDIKPRTLKASLPRMPSLHQGIIYKRSILNEIPYSLEFKICGDFDNICRLIKKYKFDILNINISELMAGGISTLKPFSLAKESYFIFCSHYSPNYFMKLVYIMKISTSLLMVKLLFLYSKRKKHFNYS